MVGCLAAAFERHAQRVELTLDMTGADARDDSSVRQHVERRECLRSCEWVLVARHEHVAHQPGAFGLCRDIRKSGDRIEVVLTVEAKNNYEYLLFEDLKPAGFEAVQLQSGSNVYVRELKSGVLTDKNAALMNFDPKNDFTGRSRWVYQELRDRKVALFIDRLPEGVWQLSYELRAEAPGAFHALPVLGHAMYVPEIRTNGAEARIRVVD